jgi:hypothetical protein
MRTRSRYEAAIEKARYFPIHACISGPRTGISGILESENARKSPEMPVNAGAFLEQDVSSTAANRSRRPLPELVSGCW